MDLEKPRPKIYEKSEEENKELNIVGYAEAIQKIFCKQLETDVVDSKTRIQRILKKRDVKLRI